MKTTGQKARNCIKQADQPFSATDLAKRAGCHETTARQAIREFHLIYAYRRTYVGNTYYRIFFPYEWTLAQCKAWLDSSTKSGKSTAKLYRLGEIIND